MPSGTKKRKAAKKKMMQRGGTHSHNRNHNHNHIAATTTSNSSSTPGSHPHHVSMDPTLVENDEVKTFEERDSDGAEVVKEEEEEKKEVIAEGEVEEGTGGLDLQEETVVETIPDKMESTAEAIVEEIKPEPASVTEAKDDDDNTIKESLVGDPAIDNGISNGDGVAVEKGEAVIEEKRELSGLSDNSDGAVKPAEYFLEEAIGVPPGASIEEVLDLIEERILDGESGKQVVNSVTETTTSETYEIADVVEPELKKDGAEVPLALPFVKDESAESSAAEQPKDKVVAPVVITNNGVDPVEELKTQELVGVKVDATAVDPSPETEVATVASREVDDSKKLEAPDNLESQPLISTQPAVRRTSWHNCCGLFELFLGADR